MIITFQKDALVKNGDVAQTEEVAQIGETT
jgi:hypothetical protein